MRSIARRASAKAVFLLGFALLSCVAQSISRGHLYRAGARRSVLDATSRKVFDVTAFGAKTEEQMTGGGNKANVVGKLSVQELPGVGIPGLPGGSEEESFADQKIDESGPGETGAGESPEEENGSAFIRTWVAACRGNYSGPSKVVIPKGTFLVGPVVFQGPCNSSTEPIVVEVQGYVKASTDLSQYSSPEWFTFELVDGMIITGDGTFDGQGQEVWKIRDNKESNSPAPSSLKFNKVNNTLIEGITSLNSKFFHTHMYGCNNVTMSNVHLTAPGDSPNTDGLHISTSSQIKVLNNIIATGDDCVSIGQGSHDITVKNITCGPGHGISIGSLGKHADELGVSQISVSNCTLRNTTNGARIKTWASESAGEATGIFFEDIIMDQVQNPIIIDQNYGSKKKEGAGPPSGPSSKWKISDVHFRNIRGTSARNVAVSLACSSTNPCEGVELTDINFSYDGTSMKGTALTSQCFNAKITSKGVQNPPLCL